MEKGSQVRACAASDAEFGEKAAGEAVVRERKERKVKLEIEEQ